MVIANLCEVEKDTTISLITDFIVSPPIAQLIIARKDDSSGSPFLTEKIHILDFTIEEIRALQRLLKRFDV